jgi:hypothetical protein
MCRAWIPAVLVLLIAGCGGGPDAKLEQARQRLAAGDFAEAVAAADAGLAAGAEGATAWRLEIAALEAEARGGNAQAVQARLARLAQTWAAQATGALYVQTAGQLKEGGDAAGAIGVLDAGAQRFPDDADIARAIEQAKATGTDAEIERLRSLGYVE